MDDLEFGWLMSYRVGLCPDLYFLPVVSDGAGRERPTAEDDVTDVSCVVETS